MWESERGCDVGGRGMVKMKNGMRTDVEMQRRYGEYVVARLAPSLGLSSEQRESTDVQGGLQLRSKVP